MCTAKHAQCASDQAAEEEALLETIPTQAQDSITVDDADDGPDVYRILDHFEFYLQCGHLVKLGANLQHPVQASGVVLSPDDEAIANSHCECVCIGEILDWIVLGEKQVGIVTARCRYRLRYPSGAYAGHYASLWDALHSQYSRSRESNQAMATPLVSDVFKAGSKAECANQKPPLFDFIFCPSGSTSKSESMPPICEGLRYQFHSWDENVSDHNSIRIRDSGQNDIKIQAGQYIVIHGAKENWRIGRIQWF